MNRAHLLADLSLTFGETAFLLWETRTPNYEFAAWFNQLYDVSLSREDDLQLSDINLPYFSHYSEEQRLLYVLIDLPQSPVGEHDKLMLINGQDAFKQQQAIYRDYATHPFAPQADDLLSVQRHQMLQAARHDIFSVHFIDYRRTANIADSASMQIERKGASTNDTPATRQTPLPDSSLLTGVQNTDSAKVRRSMKALYNFLQDILYALDSRIYDESDEEGFL